MSDGAVEVHECPYPLGDAGSAWWDWAWTTPQSVRWDQGALYTAARRAGLEDAYVVVESFDPYALSAFFEGYEVLAGEDRFHEQVRELGRIIGRLQALATGRVALSKEMRELEAQLGFGAKSMHALGWNPEAYDGDQEDAVDSASRRRAERLAGQPAAGTSSPT